MPEKQTRYDAIPYLSNPFRQTHPEHLASVASLFGLQAPSPNKCRVLELGCSMGGNLIAIAQNYPNAQCVGVDASSRQIAEGWKSIDALGFKNIQLKHADILDLGDELGEFDYIISHGVFSWVPERVQSKMLEICQKHLSHNGVAYISYNTYPGWHIRGIVRDMMFYRGMQFSDPSMQLAQAKELVKFVAQSSLGADTPYKRLLQNELNHLGKMEDYYLHHEHLEEHNRPLYFHEFAKRLSTNGLQYLGDAEFSTMVSTNFSADVAKTLHDLGAHDIVQMEQYMDFVRCRYFRKTLICRSAVTLQRAISSDVIKAMYLASEATPQGDAWALDAESTVLFSTPRGFQINCKSPLTKLALLRLRELWPMPLPFRDLLEYSKAEATAQGIRVDQSNAEQFLAGEMLTAIGAGLLEWNLAPALFTTNVSPEPLAPPVARYQAGQGYKVTNLRGELVTLDELHRQTLQHLDGHSDITAIADRMLDGVQSGKLVLHRENDPSAVTDPAEMRSLLASALDKVLQNLARKALLTAQ